MFGYYLMLGVRSLHRNPYLTVLMVLTLAIGVAASVSTLTILHAMSGDPIPGKSERLFVPQFDLNPKEGYIPGADDVDMQMAYIDANNLLRSGQGERRSALYGVSMPLEPPRSDIAAFNASGLAATRDFFAMFDVPFRHGQAWSEQDDARRANVVVLSSEVAEKLFGQASPVGKQVRMKGQPFTVVGVLDNWVPVTRYYKLVGGEFPPAGEEFIIPFSTAIGMELPVYGSMWCNGQRDSGYAALLTSNCTWIQFWFETRSSLDRAGLQTWLDNYAAEQRKLGRLPRSAPNELYNVMEWMEKLKVVGNDTRLSAWLAFGFLILCLVNTIGLLMAKFSVRATEVGVRRALGASRGDIFRQFLVETSVVGLAGGVLGLGLAFAALALIGMQSRDVAAAARMDWQMLVLTFVMSVAAAVIAGLLPTWRACQVTPAIQLKSQ